MLTGSGAPRWREGYGGPWAVELAAFALVMALGAALAPLGDPDLPMHLALGEWIVRHGAVPTVEPFAWTRAGEPFFAYSWLPEVALYGTWRLAGVAGLRVLQGLALVGAIAAVLVLARAARWSVWTAVVLAGTQALLALLIAAYLRPHLVLFLVVPLAWAAALRMLEPDARPARWAAATFGLAALAANSHLLFPLTAAPWLLLVLRWPGARRAAWLVGATVGGWMLTPYLLQWPAIFALNFGPNALFSFPTPISELRPGVQAAIDRAGGLLLLAIALGLLPWVAAPRLAARERLAWGVAWLAGLLAFALAARAIFVWWVLVMPLAGAMLEPLARVARPRALLIAQRVTLAVLVAFLATNHARAAFAPWAREDGGVRSLPFRAAPYADPIARWLGCQLPGRALPPGRAFTVFSLGTYFAWRLPALSYSIDGRNIFPDSVAAAEGYILASRRRAPQGPWRSADLAIAPRQYPVAAALDTAAGWRLALEVLPRDAAEGDTISVWVTDRWWRTAGGPPLPDEPRRLRAGESGYRAACEG